MARKAQAAQMADHQLNFKQITRADLKNSRFVKELQFTPLSRFKRELAFIDLRKKKKLWEGRFSCKWQYWQVRVLRAPRWNQRLEPTYCHALRVGTALATDHRGDYVHQVAVAVHQVGDWTS